MHDHSDKNEGGGGGNSPQTPDPQDQNIENALSKIKHKLIVMSGKGGVGKSSFATNLAVALAAKGFSTGLMDVDLHGPSIAGMVGINGLLEVSQETQQVVPKKVSEHLKVVSMQSLMKDPDQAVIWRGPAKTGIIRQFIGDVFWDALDFLIVDSPPGTGDEPLSVAQTITGAKALIVTTPQDVALADVRKSINFCRAVNLELVGLVENMGPFACPCCGKTVELFKSQGGRLTAEAMGVTFLGTLPFDPEVVKSCDQGAPIAAAGQSGPFVAALETVVQAVIGRL
ncbi:iron-sulfur cluster carrier protein [Desulfosarcina ovata subsp. sediminis]|uniref:Iron-sulfur cluster carrier protein n=1 Tax=Desulfosarcina ovata subsp. sediminis TaxID=885957 RepID=A0A5K7ZQL2_9BACT|nr:Mrp/NBP35 family ATP-binding protein [Desulfosarcina ovata]BBO79683.1 iron-sulfur cluster carrier protein [Desulfosarcina ovata subsp. sediminis]